jgi:DNA-binding PadR family transcriptional regulator
MVKLRLVASSILDVLEREGAREEEEVYRQIQRLHGDIDRRIFEELLMRLEIQGLIRVSDLSRDRRRIELVRSEGWGSSSEI